jgi:hypothetical protein
MIDRLDSPSYISDAPQVVGSWLLHKVFEQQSWTFSSIFLFRMTADNQGKLRCGNAFWARWHGQQAQRCGTIKWEYLGKVGFAATRWKARARELNCRAYHSPPAGLLALEHNANEYTPAGCRSTQTLPVFRIGATGYGKNCCKNSNRAESSRCSQAIHAG